MGRGESIDLVEEDLAPLKRKRDDEEEEEANSGWKLMETTNLTPSEQVRSVGLDLDLDRGGSWEFVKD